MRAVVQRVASASVEVGGVSVGSIADGVLVLLGVGRGDGEREAAFLSDKIANLRIFPDQEGRSNLSLLDTGGAALVISQFTLYADCRRGRRPSFTDAAEPESAEALVERFVASLRGFGIVTASGRFGAHMVVDLVNDGPFTIVLDTEELSGSRSAKSVSKGD